MRRALIVGIDHYEHLGSLTGCVNDAHSMADVLARNDDGSTNFKTPRVMTANGPGDEITRYGLKEAVRQLFSSDAEIALFYFAGHGSLEDTGGFLCSSESRTGDDGLSLAEVMTLAASSTAGNRIIILDSCNSGIVGARADLPAVAEIKKGTTILTASTAGQNALEVTGGGAGLFTSLLVDALRGGAANLIGDVTPGSVYAYIDQSLGPWGQRPVFKTNVEYFVSLRRAEPPITLADLQALAKHFPHPDYQLQLDPAFEPERSTEDLRNPAIPPPDPDKVSVFQRLQCYVKVNLVRPVGAPHMWHAAMQSKSCALTTLGRHYRNLVVKGLI